jgi:ABC-type anion transport system duplicated permease subunit
MKLILYTHKAMFFLCPVYTAGKNDVIPRNIFCEPLMFLSMFFYAFWFFWFRPENGPTTPVYWKTKLSKPIEDIDYDSPL